MPWIRFTEEWTWRKAKHAVQVFRPEQVRYLPTPVADQAVADGAAKRTIKPKDTKVSKSGDVERLVLTDAPSTVDVEADDGQPC